MRKLHSIMLIDDEEVNNLICRETIRHFDPNIQVMEYSEASKALEFLLAQSQSSNQTLPDVIFLDLNMPFMNGWAFLDQYKHLLSAFNKDVELYLLTSSSYHGDIKRAKSFPIISYYVQKPLTLDVLKRISEHQMPGA